ncbi:ABC transporter permease [Alkalihalobacillus sp. AL-G]|uniref:ABC transporter permease n=1 Tax=Alkalihalobacillus sp. AL-G TaxID=2926399 RepID=UPI00272BBA96|nr:ABC transporter permease [Alkalihalobacillus sp. AL-G]WLD94399.1 ABC transporter permease [Alkalihalobacillus sp. AL-G]
MVSYITKRLLLMIPTVLGALTIVFFAMHLVPGDPAITILGEYATEEDIENLHEQMGLNRPLGVQYLTFLGDYMTGDFGESIRSGRDVLSEIMIRVPYTLELAVASIIIAIFIGVPIGILAALKRNSLLDYLLTTISIIGVAAPSFWIGLILIIFFSIQLGWFPIISTGENTLFNVEYIVLPALSIGLAMAALIARLTRSNTLEVLGEDYVRTARAKGVNESKVVLKHVLKNAAIPIITIIGLYMGHLIGGAVIIETVFGRAGIGKYLIDSIYARDYPAVQATAFIVVVVFLFINLIVDLLYSLFNPKIRY